jgi:peroxiredoxin (alkyl hydroperoxide reductase subunit C)
MTTDGPSDVSSEAFFAGRKVVLFALPGAFTPTCSAQHLPGYLNNAQDIKAKGVDAIACLSVNDVFVMGAWAKDQGVGDTIAMLADPDGAFTRAVDMEFDLTARGLGKRSRRYAVVVEDGVVTAVNAEEGGGLTISSAESILEVL